MSVGLGIGGCNLSPHHHPRSQRGRGKGGGDSKTGRRSVLWRGESLPHRWSSRNTALTFTPKAWVRSPGLSGVHYGFDDSSGLTRRREGQRGGAGYCVVVVMSFYAAQTHLTVKNLMIGE